LDLPGRELPKAFFGMMIAAFPDFQMVANHVGVDDDFIWVRYTITGTHKGEFMGIPATHKRIEMKGFDLLRMEGDKAAEHWGVSDNLGMMQQLGVVPEGVPA
ncbi:MAG: ester cyclase, partial [Actinomycetota bacterium]|nr:ester cyclase [Actinomycetota bacterium]